MALLLFVVALAVRLLFWRATPDASWPDSAWFKGDAPIWIEFASSIERGEPYELGLPIHPPGTAHLIAALWNGEPARIEFVRLVWCVLGALAVTTFYLAAAGSFRPRVAFWAAIGAASSTGLMILSTSLNVETPYLLIVLITFLLFEKIRARPRVATLALWAALHGLACLFRVEHALFFLLVLIPLVRATRRNKGLPATRVLLSAVLFFLLPLVPWHLTAWARIGRFNQTPLSAARTLRVLPWDREALQAEVRLPAFARNNASVFVDRTLRHRGAARVRAGDLRVLEEAFGYVPEPLSRGFLVSSYGPLNFALANNPHADGGFTRAPLEEPPPLRGGPEHYPPELTAGLPPADLSFVYPPHLRLFNEGYRAGWDWIRQDAGSFARLAWAKLRIFWAGAAMGFTGYNLPLGLSGVRRGVDLVVPEGSLAAAWRLTLLIASGLALYAGWKSEALQPWLLFLTSKVAVTLLFFGYARQGATVIPVVLLLLAVAADRWVFTSTEKFPRVARWGIGLCALLIPVCVEAARFASRPVASIDGRSVAAGDPFPADRTTARRITVDSSK